MDCGVTAGMDGLGRRSLSTECGAGRFAAKAFSMFKAKANTVGRRVRGQGAANRLCEIVAGDSPESALYRGVLRTIGPVDTAHFTGSRTWKVLPRPG
jgi:hypothetical protein